VTLRSRKDDNCRTTEFSLYALTFLEFDLEWSLIGRQIAGGRKSDSGKSMKEKLTKQVVDKIEPTDSKQYIWDTAITGFVLRVNPSGSKTYLVKYRFNHRTRWYTLGKHGGVTPSWARQKALEILGLVAAGIDPATSRDENKSLMQLSDFSKEYMERHAHQKKKSTSAAEDQRLLNKYILPVLGTHSVASITRPDIAKLHSSMNKTPHQANRVLALLSKMFSLAGTWGYRPDTSNPCSQIQKFLEEPRQRFLTNKELATLGDVLRECEKTGKVQPSGITAIRLILLTGARHKEILNAKWEDIDFEQKSLYLKDSKTGARAIPLPAPALLALQQAESRAFSDYICPGRNEMKPLVGLQKIWEGIRTKAGLEDVRIHDLRHTYASVAASKGFSLIIIGKLLGHKNPATTAQYAHLLDEPIRMASTDVADSIATSIYSTKVKSS
jgi:integrase